MRCSERTNLLVIWMRILASGDAAARSSEIRVIISVMKGFTN